MRRLWSARTTRTSSQRHWSTPPSTCTTPAAAHPAFVSLVDVFPTICAALDIDQPAGVQGRSLWPLLTEASYPAEEFASAYVELGIGGRYYTEADIASEQPGLAADQGSFDELNAVTQSGVLRAVRRGDWKLVLDMQGAGQLYDLVHDPCELTNLYDQPPHVSQRKRRC